MPKLELTDPIDYLKLHGQYKNTLRDRGVFTVGDLLKTNPRNISKPRSRCIDEIDKALTAAGFNWKEFRGLQLEDLGLKTFAYNSIHNANIYSVEDLLATTPWEMARRPNVGEKTLYDIKERLEAHGFQWKEDPKNVYFREPKVKRPSKDDIIADLLSKREPLPNGAELPRLVVCAAIRVGEHIICGARHYDGIMRKQISILIADGDEKEAWRSAEQGFIDQRGEWLTRQEAHQIAWENNQVRRRCGGDTERLYSENLY